MQKRQRKRLPSEIKLGGYAKQDELGCRYGTTHDTGSKHTVLASWLEFTKSHSVYTEDDFCPSNIG